MKPLALAIPLAFALQGCSDAASTASAPLVRDSAGIQIVENTAPAWGDGEAWTVADSAMLDIGTLNGPAEYQLFRVLGATRLADGSIVVANSGTHQLRFFDEDGAYQREVGAEGEGPGEFTGLSWVGTFHGDSIAAWDFQLKRLSIFDPSSAFVRSSSPAELTGFLPLLQVMFDDGSYVATSGLNPGAVFASGSGVRRDSLDYLYFAADGTLVDTIGRFPGQENRVVVSGTSLNVSSLPFGRETFTSTDGDHLYVATGDSYEISVYDRSGDLIRVIRTPTVRKTVTDADIAEYRSATLARITDPNELRREEQSLSEIPFPEEHPALIGMEVDSEGNIWVAEARPDGDTPTWSVFDSQGRLLGQITTPKGFHVQEIGSDYILGTWADDFEVQHVRLHSLKKP